MTEENIRIDCYFAMLDKYKKMYPNAHFEVITRSANHILSPSKGLLDKVMDKSISFYDYAKIFIVEMQNKEALLELERLREIAKKKILFLVCFEKDPMECHRSLVRNLMLFKEEPIQIRKVKNLEEYF